MAKNKKEEAPVSAQNGKMEKIVSLCKRRGFVFPGSEIYGGLANSWDYGPYGVEMKNNIKQKWWKFFVQEREDMVGIDAALIMNPKVWEASGHLKEFSDPLVECKNQKCHKRFRWDQIKVMYEGPRAELDELGPDEDILGAFWICENCGTKNLGIETKGREGDLRGKFDVKQFNLMFKTFIGPSEEQANVAYLRPENAQGMFVNFKNVLNTTRRRLPFGIAQIGRNFRNEITPGNFIFRTREFEIAELEYFIRPEGWEKKFEMWLEDIKIWWRDVMRINMNNLIWHEIPDGERAHYSKRTVDIEYKYPFGVKELHGIAYRTDFDLRRHEEVSGEDLKYTDPETGEKILPHVIEPTFGVDRMLLVSLLEAYQEESAPTGEGEEDTRVVMKFPSWLAPIKIAILPLSKKEDLSKLSHEIYNELRKNYTCEYDETQSIGKRYRRQDEIGTPYCVTVDFESLEDKKVTIRERDSMKQERVDIADLVNIFQDKLK
ncbi:MAG: glycine--tRNA ligase [Patescibacteria group bacterium]|nr:glycine--tRNA ligase [Patescibacteria group bacterium]MDD5490388.1 glycine--tRNA ligase [Patescibacteria group bacterium]